MVSNDGIQLRIRNSFRTTFDAPSTEVYGSGQTTVEADSRSDGDGIDIYIQKKGFGSEKPKSIRAHFDNDTVLALMAFFQRHGKLAEQYSAMLAAASSVAKAKYEQVGQSMPVDELEISERTVDCLKAGNILTVSQLVGMSESSLLKLPNLGRKALNQIKETLAIRGITLKLTDGD